MKSNIKQDLALSLVLVNKCTNFQFQNQNKLECQILVAHISVFLVISGKCLNFHIIDIT